MTSTVTSEEILGNLKAFWEQIPEPKVSYKVWLKKLHRATTGNVRTTNAVARKMGLPVKRKPSRTPAGLFVAYDGEGWGSRYALLANSLGECISNPAGLSTLDCLELLTQHYDKKIVRIFFAFGYDVNHILRDVSDDLLKELLEGRIITYQGYRIQYIPGKIFIVNNIKYYDVFGFFQTSFVNVVRTMLGESAVTDRLLEGKEARGTFETWTMEKIIEYNANELELLVEVMNKLREAFESIGTYLSEWYGPGAVAKYWFKKYDVVLSEKYTPDVLTALSKAYYGGRFEQVKLGTISPIYEYDIHSAYPAAMVDMPYFDSWKHVQQYRDNPYSIWFVSFDFREYAKDGTAPFLPLPMRSRDGRICFPLVGRGWYWNSEIQVALRHFPGAKISFHEGYVATTRGQPFAWIRELYNYRAELKRTGNLAHYAIKVGLNSLYGKTAQRIGRNTHFSLAWAGYITSTTRSKLADAAYTGTNPNAVVGFATDALFTTQRCNLPISDNLGDWEESCFDSGTFFQSGVYRVVQSNRTIDRYRGAPLRRGIDNIVSQLKEHPYDKPEVRIGRFIGHLLAIRAPKAYQEHRLSFVQVPFVLQLDAPYKRHYVGFLEYKNDNLVPNYGKLLSKEITSLPKIWVDDTNLLLWNEYLYDNISFQNVESYPPPLKDAVLQRLVEEGVLIAAEDGGISTMSDLDGLPVVKDDVL